MSAADRALRWTVIAGLAITVAAACGGTPPSHAIASLDHLPATTTTTAAPALDPPATVSDRQQRCDEQDLATATYEPAENLHIQPGSFMETLRERGWIVVGVDENTEGLSARNVQTGKIEGFEVDLAYEIASWIFGADADLSDVVRLVPLLTSEKTPHVASGKVDLTISAVSMSCGRWEEVDFSREYYTAHQEFLMRSDSTIEEPSDLAGRVVCVTANSSSSRIMERLVPEAVLLPVAARTDCLVALQEGRADAYFGHDTFLYGMSKQDPTLVIRPVLEPEDTVSHYGIAIHADHREFTRFVNRVLDNLIVTETWHEMADYWLRERLGIEGDLSPPASDYRRGA